MYKNLKEETLEILADYGKTVFDIEWFGTHEFVIDMDIQKLFDFTYDGGYGGNEIPMDLVVVGKDFWLERHEYDGAEWWEFKKIPTKPSIVKEQVSLKYW